MEERQEEQPNDEPQPEDVEDALRAVVWIDGPRGGVNWAFFKFLRQLKQP